MQKRVEPSISETAFNCPHCDVLAAQIWYVVDARPIRDGGRVPPIADEEMYGDTLANEQLDESTKQKYLDFIQRAMEGLSFFSAADRQWPEQHITNLNISSCYNCQELSIWVYDRLIDPTAKLGVAPNADLDADIQRDFNEARSIVNLSPRGAAALLRLAVQKLCKQLGEDGKNIDTNIGDLVAKGLSANLQKALDVVRVIGNEAVHPGELDLRDDRSTAVALFGIVNAIAEQMISQPKAVDALYASLPASKRDGIEARNAKALAPKPTKGA